MSLLYVIDGYNIVNHPEFCRARKASGGAQAALIDFIVSKRLTGSAKNKVIVVFDGYPAPVEDRGEKFQVVFSRRISADERIKKIVEERAQRKSIIVVSDDAEIKFSARSLGACTLGVEEFISAKDKPLRPSEDAIDDSLGFTEKQRINDELRKLWLE